MVVDQGRQRRLPAIIEAFFTLAGMPRKGHRRGHHFGTSSEDQTNRLAQELSKVTRKRVFLKPMVDESILGGVIVKIENKVIDGSVKHRLQEMKNEMIKTA